MTSANLSAVSLRESATYRVSVSVLPFAMVRWASRRPMALSPGSNARAQHACPASLETTVGPFLGGERRCIATGLRKDALGLGIQRPMIGFEPESIVGLGIQHRLGHCRMAMQSVRSHRAALEHEIAQQLKRCGDLVATRRPRLRNGHPGLAVPHADHQRWHVAAAFLVPPPQALAVDRHNALRRPKPEFCPQRRHEGRKGLGQFGWIEQPEQAAERVVAWRSVRQFDDLGQLLLAICGKLRHFHTALRATQRRSQSQKQDRLDGMASIHIARIAHFLQNRNIRLHRASSTKGKLLQNHSTPRSQQAIYSSAIPLPSRGEGTRRCAGRHRVMKFTLSWLKEHLATDEPLEKLADK